MPIYRDYLFRAIIKLILCVIALVGFSLIEESAKAFCVYNKTDTEIKVEQTEGGKTFRSFSCNLKSGKHSCCNWKNRDCNKNGKKDSVIKFKVSYTAHDDDVHGILDESPHHVPKLGVTKVICEHFSVKAGGWLEVTGENGKYHCKAGFNYE